MKYYTYKMVTNKNLFKIFNSSRVIFSYKFTHNWSPLALVFNQMSNFETSFNVLKNTKGLFDVPELTSPYGFHALKEACALNTDKLINEAVSPRRNRKMVQIFDELSDTLCKVADLAEFIRVAHPDPLYSKTAESTCIAVSGIVEKLNTHYELYNMLKHVKNNGDIFPTSLIDQHTTDLFLFDFEQNGIHLSDRDRSEVVRINDAILHVGQHFMAGASNYRTVNKYSLPESVRNLFDCDGDNVLITGLHSESSNPVIREYAYKIFLHPVKHQEDLLIQLLNLRYQLAQKCGFSTYSERVLKGSLVETPEVVYNFLNELSEGIKSHAEEEFSIMNKMKKVECSSNFRPLAAWDVLYFSYKLKKENFQVSSSEYAPYFSLGACMEGLNNLMQYLYGVSLVNTEVNPGETWAPHIFKLAVVHETEGLFGYIYCDFFARTGKPNQDCHFTIQGGKILPNGTYQIPVVVLMLNLPLPYWSRPSLLSPNMVDNLFHEMGHAMHSMLARTQYQHVTGTRCCTDFAEVPSILMEYFASDPRVLASFAKHFQTGVPMPQKMLNSLCASKYIFAASEMQLQVFYSVLDQVYHSKLPDLNFSNTTDILAKIQSKYYSLSYVPGTAWQLRFSHLVGYGAKYYSYLVSKAVASWIWHLYFEKDPFNRENGNRYRNECLSHGGGKPARQLLVDYLQRDVTPNKLAECLIVELDDRSKNVVKYYSK